MSLFLLTGDDTLTIDGVPVHQYLAGTDSHVAIELPNEKFTMETGKNGNTIFADNRAGMNGRLTIRCLVGSDGDIFLNGIAINDDKDFVSSGLHEAIFTQRLGNSEGIVRYKQYTLSGGKFINYPATSGSARGDVTQGVAEYQVLFAVCTPAIL